MDIQCSGSKQSDFDFTRRELLQLTAATGGAVAAGQAPLRKDPAMDTQRSGSRPSGKGPEEY